jgi:UPF0716 protein FxsA
LVLLLLVPLVEIYVIVKVASHIGALDTLLLLIAVSLFGAWIVKRQGVGLWRQVQDDLSRGELPPKRLLNGFLLLLAGALLLVPGFVTDVIGLILLLPPVRELIARRITRRASGRITVIRATTGPVIDTTEHQGPGGPQRPPAPPELEGP